MIKKDSCFYLRVKLFPLKIIYVFILFKIKSEISRLNIFRIHIFGSVEISNFIKKYKDLFFYFDFFFNIVCDSSIRK